MQTDWQKEKKRKKRKERLKENKVLLEVFGKDSGRDVGRGDVSPDRLLSLCWAG